MRVINLSKDLSLMSVRSGDPRHELEAIKANQAQMSQNMPMVQREETRNESIDDPSPQLMVGSLEVPLVKNVPIIKGKHVGDSFTFVSALLFILIFINTYWLVVGVTYVDAYRSDTMMYMFKNTVVVLIVVMSQVYRWIDDTGQVGRPCPHLISK